MFFFFKVETNTFDNSTCLPNTVYFFFIIETYFIKYFDDFLLLSMIDCYCQMIVCYRLLLSEAVLKCLGTVWI